MSMSRRVRNSMKTLRSNRQGFTLIEILIVVMIIGLIASLVSANLMGRFDKAKEETTKAQVEMLAASVMAFTLDVNRCPVSLQELVQSQDPKWRGPYLSKNTVPRDPWDKEFQYKCPGEHGRFDLYSLGPNGVLDERSLKNW